MGAFGGWKTPVPTRALLTAHIHTLFTYTTMVQHPDVGDVLRQPESVDSKVAALTLSTNNEPSLAKDAAEQNIKNVFEFEEFIDRHEDYDRATLDALKMVDLDNLHETSPISTDQAGSLLKLANAEDIDPQPHGPERGALYQIAYNPNEKAKRLGRPRKHLGANNTASSVEIALKNLETSKLLKFRLDNMPLEGPGSRGGDPDDRKRLGKLTESTATKKRKQSVLNFATLNNSTSVGIQANDSEKPADALTDSNVPEKHELTVNETPKVESPPPVDSDVEVLSEPIKSEALHLDITSVVSDSKDEKDESTKDADLSKTDDLSKPVETNTKTQSNGKSKVKSEPAPKTKRVTLKFRNKITRTSIVREKNRITRTYPGPLVALHYDLYDDNLFEVKENSTVASEPVGLGFNVKRNPYLSDVIFIMAFLAKFPEILYVGHIGPQDIEEGLGLANTGEGGGLTGVSRTMDDLFCKLLTLVLNRKKVITPGNYKSGVQDLRSNYISFGLPEEWRDDSLTRVVTSLPTDEADRVDPSKPPVSEEDNYEYLAPLEKLNPMHERSFEEEGLAGISNPVDRLIMIRCLVLWSLSASNVLKTHLAQVVNKQEIAGEKDTIYASRPILKGFSQTTELKKDLESKLAKKGKTNASPQGTPDPDSTQRYIDPTSDPVVHPMALRLNEFIVGDCGFRIGRFHLVRMAEPSGGGISSVDRMKAVAKDPTGIKLSIPSRFKLYVEDVHSVLLDSLRVFGVEFDKDGNEVQMPPKYDNSKHWYEVAANASELIAFNKHLAQKLGLASNVPDDFSRISQNSVAYKPILYMHQYLSLIAPLMESFENMEQTAGAAGSRSARKKVDYNVSKSSSYMNAFEEGYDEHMHDDDDDSYDEGEPADDDDEEYLE